MMNKMNMKFHEIFAIVKKISVHNENIHVHQAPFFDGTASNKKKRKLSWVMVYMYEVELFH